MSELKVNAENATQGRWEADKVDAIVFMANVVPNESIAGICEDGRISANGTLSKRDRLANAKFIATANPQVVMALLNEIDRLSDRCVQLNKDVNWLLRNRKCKTSMQHMSVNCPARTCKNNSDINIKPCGLFGSPIYTEDECVQFWRKILKEQQKNERN